MKYISKLTFVFLIVAVSQTLQGCGPSKAKEEEAATKQPEVLASHEGFILNRDRLTSAIQIPGELIAFQQVDLYAKVSSFVKKLHVDVGSEVKQGQLLASMEAPELSNAFAGSESRLKAQEAIYLASKASYDRLAETSKTPGTVSQNDLDFALAKKNSDLAQLDAARSASKEVGDTRNYLEIRAPFSGIISARNVSAGAYVGPSGKGSEFPLFTLVEQRKLRLVVSLPEAYSSYLTRQTTVNFKVKSLPNDRFMAKVSRLAGALDAKLRAQRVEMDVSNEDRRLLPGMIAEVSVPFASAPNAFVVPKSAVLNSTLGTYLIQVKNNKAAWVSVKLGTSALDKTEVFGDIKEGDVFLTTVSEEIRDQSPIRDLKTANP